MADPKKIAADCFRKGNEAIPKANWDYAIQMYGMAVKMVPDNLMFRQTLRATEQKKYDNNGKGASMASMKLMTTRAKIKKVRYSKNWKELDETAEEGLTVNPWDGQLNADLGDAAKELGYSDVAIFAYEEALKADPKNIDVNKSLSELLEERGEYKRAAACWERIYKAEPLNGEARSKIQQLQASTVMDRGGYEGAQNTRNVMSDASRAIMGGGKTADGPGMSVDADLLRAIRKDPGAKDNYLKLAEHYKREGKLEEAEEQLRAVLDIAKGDLGIGELLEDVQLDLLRKNLMLAKEHATNTPDDMELKKRAGEIARELLNREIEIFSSRVDRYPNDMKIKFELAQRFMRVQKWQQAIPLFQVSRGDPRIKGESLVNLGKCFAYDKKPPLARRQFESALPEIKFDNQPDLFKDLRYHLARLCEELKDNAASEQYYQEILEVDYGYKDVNARLEKLQGGGGEEAAPA